GTRLAVVALGGNPPTVHDVATGELVCSLNGLSGQEQVVAFSPDGKRIATATLGRGPDVAAEVKLWEAATGRELLTLQSLQAVRLGHLRFSPDGYRLIIEDGATKRETTWEATPRANAADIPR